MMHIRTTSMTDEIRHRTNHSEKETARRLAMSAMLRRSEIASEPHHKADRYDESIGVMKDYFLRNNWLFWVIIAAVFVGSFTCGKSIGYRDGATETYLDIAPDYYYHADAPQWLNKDTREGLVYIQRFAKLMSSSDATIEEQKDYALAIVSLAVSLGVEIENSENTMHVER